MITPKASKVRANRRTFIPEILEPMLALLLSSAEGLTVDQIAAAMDANRYTSHYRMRRLKQYLPGTGLVLVEQPVPRQGRGPLALRYSLQAAGQGPSAAIAGAVGAEA